MNSFAMTSGSKLLAEVPGECEFVINYTDGCVISITDRDKVKSDNSDKKTVTVD